MTDTAALVARLEQVAARLESAVSRVAAGGAAAPAAAAGGSASSSASLDGFDEVVTGPLATFLSASKAIGGEVAAQAALVDKAFAAQRAFLAVAATSKQPDQATFGTLLADTSSAMQEIGNFRESNRKSAQFNQLSAVSEGIPALGWVTVTPKPAPFIKEMIAACQFYSNRVLKDFKESDPKQVDWAKAYVATLEALYEYVKRVHTTGLVWNANGGAASAAPKAAPAAAAPAAAAPAAAAPAKPAGGGLFAELSKGEGVTSGLKKVDKSQMTHKNPELRASSVVKADDVKPKEPAKPAAGAAAAVKKPPVFELQGKKWVVENQENNRELVIEDCNLKQSVYIFKCNNSTIQIKGKINSISLDSCKKTAVVFNDCVASFESVNCQSIQVQVTGKVPTVSIDKTDGIQVYLGKDSLDTEIVTAKSSEMNIMVPGDVDGDFTEIPLPEQFKTVWDPKNKRFNTTTNEIAG